MFAETDSPLSPSPGHFVLCEGWNLWETGVVGSTNDLAAQLPPWHAVRAAGQTAGRGRFGRNWISDSGGLWLSAVVPTGPPEQGWGALPLVAGLSVCEALGELGTAPLRMRWPNDIMSGDRKLAGLLVDQFRPGSAVVGLGLNVSNRPEVLDPALEGEVIRLSELLDAVPHLPSLAVRILRSLRANIEAMQCGGFGGLLPRINLRWAAETCVELDLHSSTMTGAFLGVDVAGRLQMRTANGTVVNYGAHQIKRLRELTGR